MLRLAIVLLVAANLLFFGWASGAFDPLISNPALRPDGDREPDRLRRQVRPETIRLLPANAASAAIAAAGSAAPEDAGTTVCVEAGPFATDAEVATARTALAELVDPAALQLVRGETPGAWIVYLGRYASDVVRQRRQEDLARRGIAAEPIDTPATLAPGLVLGRFARQDAAEAALPGLATQGLRSARIVALEAPATGTLLRVSRAAPALATRLGAMDLGGRRFAACRGAG